MLNSELQTYIITSETCKFLSFCLILLKFLILEYYIRQKRASIEKRIFGKRQKKGQYFFQGGARAPLAPPFP